MARQAEGSVAKKHFKTVEIYRRCDISWGGASPRVQFIKNGPDVPDRLLQAHEDGKIVFFCGAGFHIRRNYPASRGWLRRYIVS